MNEQKTLFKYNPGLMDQEQLRSTFVGREELLMDLLGKVRSQTKAATFQHYVLIGPRGIGKTNTLLMLRDRLLSDTKLSKRWIPVLLAEEEYCVYGLCDFLARVVQLAAEEHGGDFSDLLGQVPLPREAEGSQDKAVSLIREFCSRTNQRLLVLADNLDTILGDQMVDDVSIRKLRSLLMNEPLMLLIGTSTTFFDEIANHDLPFFEFFESVYLRDLTEGDVEALLRRRAQYEGNEQFLAHFEQHKKKIKVIMELTGGNPRLVLLLYEVLTENPLIEIINALGRLLDELTPYFKAQMDALPLQQRKVVDAIMRAGGAATPSQVAQTAGWGQPLVNALFGRLKERGFIRVRPVARRTKATQYVVSDQLFRIWYQMRYLAEGRRKIGYIVEFVRLWYSRGEAARLVKSLGDRFKQLLRQGEVAAAADCIARISYLITALPEPRKHKHRIDNLLRMLQADQFEEVVHEASEQLPACRAEGNHQLAGWYCAYAGIASMRLEQWDSVLQRGEEVLECARLAGDSRLEQMARQLLCAGHYFTARFAESARLARSLLGSVEGREEAELLKVLAVSESQLGHHRSAVEFFNRLAGILEVPPFPQAIQSYAAVGDWHSALELSSRASEAYPKEPYAWVYLAECMYHVGRVDEARRAGRKLIGLVDSRSGVDADADRVFPAASVALAAIDNSDTDFAVSVAGWILQAISHHALDSEAWLVVDGIARFAAHKKGLLLIRRLWGLLGKRQVPDHIALFLTGAEFACSHDESLLLGTDPDTERIVRSWAADVDNIPQVLLSSYAEAETPPSGQGAENAKTEEAGDG